MFGLKFTTFCFVVSACAVLSHQKPLDENLDEMVKKVTLNAQSNDEKVNSSGSPATPLATDKTRSAIYPNAGGFGYYNLGQTTLPISHYPTAWPYQTYNQAPLMNNMQYKNEEGVHTDARTLGHLKPQLYSQYQQVAVPQVYSYPVQSYEYSPYVSGLGNHYSGYSSYPYYRDAEEEKPRQFMNYMPSEKYISPVQPSVQYASKYLVGKPFNNMEIFGQPQMMQQTPMLIRNAMPESKWQQARFLGRDAAENSFSELQGRRLTIDDKLQMQIPNDYLLEKLHMAPYSDAAQSSMFTQQQMSRAAEEPRPVEWNQPLFMNQPTNFKSGEISQQIQDPYISPKDYVYVEPYHIPESSHVQGARSVDSEMMATYPNQDQQMRIAQMQYYHNAMNNAAAQMEPIAQEYIQNRPTYMPNFPGPMTGKSAEGEQIDVQKLFSDLQQLKKHLEAHMEAEKVGKKDAKTETTKVENKEQNVAGVKGDVSATSNKVDKRT